MSKDIAAYRKFLEDYVSLWSEPHNEQREAHYRTVAASQGGHFRKAMEMLDSARAELKRLN